MYVNCSIYGYDVFIHLIGMNLFIKNLNNSAETELAPSLRLIRTRTRTRRRLV